MEILIQDLQKKIPIRPQRIARLIKTILRKKGIRSCQLSVVFVSPQRMRAINERYLKHSYTTDVLTFNFIKSSNLSLLGRSINGEIIISPLMARHNARLYQTTTDHEIVLYLIHGILHLLGFDDHRPRDILKMRREEKKLLALVIGADKTHSV